MKSELNRLLTGYLFLGSFFMHSALTGQVAEKVVNQQVQTWLSLNTTVHLTERWGVIGDVHIRRNQFLADPNFYFLRVGANYWIREKFSLATGYAHMWLLPINESSKVLTRENRVYQQALISARVDRTVLIIRLRNEQRWQQVLLNNEPTNDWRFTNRVRTLISFGIPLSAGNSAWSLVASDEILLNFGDNVVFNTFDQNRLFLGVRKQMSKAWSFDTGYMNVYQQRLPGFVYDMNHTFRVFFYFNPDFRKKKTERLTLPDNRDE